MGCLEVGRAVWISWRIYQACLAALALRQVLRGQQGDLEAWMLCWILEGDRRRREVVIRVDRQTTECDVVREHKSFWAVQAVQAVREVGL